MDTPVGKVPRISSSLVWADRLGSFKARWGIGRMHYTVDPGLYALGEPGENAPVLVTANYKMSFDRLREALPGRDVWILVLDTKGINVWCAAGKGTFGTMELVDRISSGGVDRLVTHRQLILPQLAGPGVAAHQVKKLSGFKVIYGPIRAEDLPAFLEHGLKATPEMRLKTFTTRERVILIPVEMVSALKAGLIITGVMIILSGFLGSRAFWDNILTHGLFVLPAIMIAILAGAVIAPLLLPWLPGRAFSVKGLSLGLMAAVLLLLFRLGEMVTWGGRLEMIAWLLLVPAAATYLSMNFTGASTYTSLSGVKKEMRWALPFQIGACAVGLSLWVWSIFVA
jgi:acetyl-CoA decarbonylase/synthase complex subunit gamma